jgi:hypothetical protein
MVEKRLETKARELEAGGAEEERDEFLDPWLSQQLRGLHKGLLDERLPDGIERLVEQLEERISRSASEGDADSEDHGGER